MQIAPSEAAAARSPWCRVATVSPWGLRGHLWRGHIPMILLQGMADGNPLIAGQNNMTSERGPWVEQVFDRIFWGLVQMSVF